ncbi:SDR family NAD(P)-dependent oxidoreductase [Streptomyces gobiensis]|uniref:SDR family NAD(P)-dependent oxidoreductase n=1 Tax=Streptomyces gobiensis TaxID=2875706 RepID=UPI001E5A0AAE|nr:SDR family oxidoreductase [Streptomyces gobiensis]UGY94133.1 SDR family oxidoreductase [Streptomyces gobiensis]
MSELCKGRTALVTGAGRGIGAAIAGRLAAEGATVAVNDIDQEAAERTAGEVGGLAVAANVADHDKASGVVDRVEKELGGLDILVNNAGIGYRGPLAEHTPKIWNRVLAVNLSAPFFLAQRAAPLLARNEGAVVNLCSVAMMGISGQVAYDVSKGGLATLTRSLAVELGRAGVRANAVCPGFIDTPMLEQAKDLVEIGARHVRTQPIRRLGTPEEVAAAVSWLASTEASYITGQCLFVDGGWVRS